IIEKHPAHDVMFYNVMRAASEQGKSLPDIFGPQEAALPAALVMRSHRVNRILAVSKPVAEELRFLGPAFQKRPIDLVYNGIGATKISVEVKNEAHKRLEEYARRLLGWRPDYVFTHVARPVISKAFWRDLQVMAELDPKLVAAGQRAVLFLLASATLPRQPAEVAKMEKDHDWPLQHQKGYPDLVGPEVAIDRAVKAFNRKAKASCAVFINQFGWSRALCGSRMPTAMLETDIRRGSDVEFGLSAYEPFGIAQIEPLPFGTLCAISATCGCRGFVEQVDVKHELPTLYAKEYALPQRNMSLNKLTKMTAREAVDVEKDVAAQLADELFAALPRSDKDRKRYLMLGYRYARQMSWDVVVRDMFLPAIKECLG
ncbi:MAG: hypothetical protein JXA69_03940, partial [Phycisphaerae bacterium]|nr:hypothetical protein [Phycisphaerae bacterium]